MNIKYSGCFLLYVNYHLNQIYEQTKKNPAPAPSVSSFHTIGDIYLKTNHYKLINMKDTISVNKRRRLAYLQKENYNDCWKLSHKYSSFLMKNINSGDLYTICCSVYGQYLTESGISTLTRGHMDGSNAGLLTRGVVGAGALTVGILASSLYVLGKGIYQTAKFPLRKVTGRPKPLNDEPSPSI